MNNRRFISIVSATALAMSLILAGCGSSKKLSNENLSTSEKAAEGNVIETTSDSGVVIHDNRSSEASNNSTGDDRAETSSALTSVSDSDFDKQGYIYEDSIGNTLYYVVITNNSASDVSVSGDALAYNADGNTIGAAQSGIDILGAGEQSICCFYFDDVDSVSEVNCTFTYSQDLYYEPVVKNIKLEEYINDQNVTVKAMNTGEYPAQFLEVYALFFNHDNNIVYASSRYITDGNSELKPGATMSSQLQSYKDFDHVEVYLTGRCGGFSYGAENASVDDSDFDVKEYSYTNSIGSTILYLVIQNNSDEIVSIDGNATAYDASNSVIGAGDCSVDVLGPGEKSLAYFFFESTENADHFDYKLNYTEQEYYKPVLSDLSTNVSVNKSNVVATVTNTADYAAQFVEVYALFLDADNNLIYATSSYATDDDSEIKPGASESVQLTTYKDFDHVEVYLTGRATNS